MIDDRRTLAITFIGGKAYDPSEPCSEDYVPWVRHHDDALEVAVARVHPPGQVLLPAGAGCTAEGYGYTFLLEMTEAFEGTTVRDLAGGSLWVAAPAGLAELRGLPPGWALQGQYDEPGATPPLWVRNYTLDGAAPVPNNGPANLFLYQSFDGATSIGGGDVIHSVTVNGDKVLLYEDSRTGELILQWRIGEIGLAIDANLADFTIDDLLELAESAELPVP